MAERLSYDAWGQRRSATTWAAGVVTASEHRGYTRHEHLDDVGVIHMNGRIYSPSLGMMLNPDPVTQAPENGQNYDRYTYAMNNPLRFIDPTGYVCSQPNWDGDGHCSVASVSLWQEILQGLGFGNSVRTPDFPVGLGDGSVSPTPEAESLEALIPEIQVPDPVAPTITPTAQTPTAPSFAPPSPVADLGDLNGGGSDNAGGRFPATVVRTTYNPYRDPEYVRLFRNAYTGDVFDTGRMVLGAAANQAIKGGAYMLGTAAAGAGVTAICIASGFAVCLENAAIGVGVGGVFNRNLGRPFFDGAGFSAVWGVATGPIAPALTGGRALYESAYRVGWEVRVNVIGFSISELASQ